MKKLLPMLLVLFLVAGVPGAWAKNSFSGSSFGSSSFKSIRQMDLPSPATSTRGLTAQQSPVIVTHPPMFFFIPMGGGFSSGYGGGGFDGGWILILVVGAAVLFFVFRRRVPVQGPDDEEVETLEVMYGRCQKNLDTLASTYLDAQAWLERLEGKIPAAQWKDWNDKFTRVSIDDFTSQLKDIRASLDQGREVAARSALFSFDEDAVAVFEFFREMENTLEEVG